MLAAERIYLLFMRATILKPASFVTARSAIPLKTAGIRYPVKTEITNIVMQAATA